FVARARTVNFKSKADNAGRIMAILDAVANPNAGAGRVAYIIPVVAPSANANAQATLNNTANPGGRARTAHINVVTHGGVSGVSTSGAGPIPGGQSLAAGPTAMAAGDVGVPPYAGATTGPTFGTPVSVAGTTVAPTVHNH